MALSGRAFLAIWHGLRDGIRSDFDDYHTREHMPERLGIPGFLRGRRFMKDEADGQVCFTLYEGAHSETFRSPAYLARLNDPTAETRRIQPHMTDFMRGVFSIVRSTGEGAGGVVSTIRLQADDGPDIAGLESLCQTALSAPGICCVHLGLSAEHVTNTRTSETALRSGEAQRVCDAVVLVEAVGVGAAQATVSTITSAVSSHGFSLSDVQTYRLAFETSWPGRPL